MTDQENNEMSVTTILRRNGKSFCLATLVFSISVVLQISVDSLDGSDTLLSLAFDIAYYASVYFGLMLPEVSGHH